MLQVTKNLRLAFEGENVMVVLKNIHAYIIEKTEEGAQEIKGSAITTGYWIDYDDCFLYLGSETGQVEEAVALENIAAIRLFDEETENFVSFPESETEIN